MSVVSQRFSRIPNARGTSARENNAVSLGSAIGARGLPPQLYSRLCKPLTCSDATRPGAHDLLRGLLRLTECSHHVGSSGFCCHGFAVGVEVEASLRFGGLGGLPHFTGLEAGHGKMTSNRT